MFLDALLCEVAEKKTIQGLLREMVVSVSQRVSKEEGTPLINNKNPCWIPVRLE